MQRDLEMVRGQVELVMQHVASELLLSKDADRRLSVKRLLSMWTECNSTVLAKGNSTIKELVS